jgi:hypothetical protein
MAEKPEFVDTISQATRQRWRRAEPSSVRPAVKREGSRLSHWPPKSWLEWRIENFMPWRLKSWTDKFRDGS